MWVEYDRKFRAASHRNRGLRFSPSGKKIINLLDLDNDRATTEGMSMIKTAAVRKELPPENERCWQVLKRMQRAFVQMEPACRETGLKQKAKLNTLLGDSSVRGAKSPKPLLFSNR